MTLAKIKQVQALTIAGFDSGGGAGLQADLKTFQECKVFGTSVLTALPIQNTRGVKKVYDIPLAAIQDQLEVVAEDFKISAYKMGMLFTTEIIQLIAAFIQGQDFGYLVVDPVMIAKSGQKLLLDSAITSLIKDILPLATVITPNLPEAEVILQRKIEGSIEMEQAAYELQRLGAKNVVIKGGHSQDFEVSADVLLLDDGTIHWFSSPRIDTENTHGTGCTFSACITAELAKGASVKEAVEIAKAFIEAALSYPIDVGHGHGPTNHWAYNERNGLDG
ncbi:bifunctional hydroxymethylpyrimidine kinase/phosphomethylpyrimidine kinase [Carnobacterium gallinarum]|uniref:bifunctional hydroxymethylpyrimidine kinase/phosphomethylpyrimidine kinase n=1 Tax=Carnobacterium gallinarum TaxID=2749 RepID=UPI0005515E08|nr:bifunctional hydroxymethylpyrimidine kinase/phosphomethylpyrimidine kinase [Carnobacterium gallinarum]